MIQGWEAIRDEALRRIKAREWVPGETIPNEEDLAREFGCARATVNRALRDLAEAGFLERRRKAGTRVTLLPVRKAVLEIPVIRREVEARGAHHSHRVLAERHAVPPPPVASRLNHSGDMLYVETLHLADGRPFSLESRWLNTAVLPTLPDLAKVSLNEWLVGNVPYATGDIVFSAEPADPREAAALGLAEGAALFITERVTRTPEAPITLVRLAHAPGYRLTTEV